MQDTLNKMRNRAKEDRGFTMIELLVVVVIIGVLVAIAVPVYLNYRQGAANKSAASDVRGAITAVEQYYTENGNTLPASTENAAAGGGSINLPAQNGGVAQTITVSPGNRLAVNDKTSFYTICAQNLDGDVVYVYNSSKGGSVRTLNDTYANCKTAANP